MQDHYVRVVSRKCYALQKYGVGQPVRRKKTTRWVRGKGKYTDDFALPGGLLLDGPLQPRHGPSSAASTPRLRKPAGVLGVWTGRRPRGGRLQPLHLRPAIEEPGRLAAAADQSYGAFDRKVRYVGDPMPLWWRKLWHRRATPRKHVELDIEPLPAVTDAPRPTKPGAAAAYEHIPNNVALGLSLWRLPPRSMRRR